MSFLQRFSLFLAGVMAVFSFLTLPSPGYEPKDEEQILLNATILSDVHSGPINPVRQSYINKAVKNAGAAKGGCDALLLLGDNTMNGKDSEYAYLYYGLKVNNTADNLLMAIGNHDYWSGESNEVEKNRFISYYNTFFDNDIDNVYYYKVINGYYFIILGDEDNGGKGSSDVNSYLSPEQIEWLDEVMAEATADGKPVFVFSHQPFARIDQESKAPLEAVIKSYDNVFFFTGHMHHPINAGSFAPQGGSVYYIDVPGFNGSDDTPLSCDGVGFQIEVYEDSVVLRARDYIDNQWLSEYEYPIELV